ncbi:MAG: hypothetical protein Q9213_006800 [Squamulea squamosa]
MFDTFYRFMDLPIEIRAMIYDLALVRGKICVPTLPKKFRDELDVVDFCAGCNNAPYRLTTFDKYVYHRYLDFLEYTEDAPPIFLSLLQGVSKAVQAEAEAVFYGSKNLFVMPAGVFVYPAVHGRVVARRPPFQSLSFTFDMRDSSACVCKDSHIVRRGVNQQSHQGCFDVQLTQQQRLQLIHDLQRFALEGVWNARCLIIKDLDLRYLELDFEECYCPMGCCRMVDFVCARLWALARLCKTLERIDVLGLASRGEARRVRLQLAGDERSWGDADQEGEDGNREPCPIGWRLANSEHEENEEHTENEEDEEDQQHSSYELLGHNSGSSFLGRLARPPSAHSCH